MLTSAKTSYLALARDGLIEEQAAAILLLQARVFRPRRTGSSAGPSEGLEVVGGQRRRRRGRVGLVAGGGPAPVASRRAVAGRRERTGGTVVFPRPAQNLWGTEVSPKERGQKTTSEKDKESKLEMEASSGRQHDPRQGRHQHQQHQNHQNQYQYHQNQYQNHQNQHQHQQHHS